MFVYALFHFLDYSLFYNTRIKLRNHEKCQNVRLIEINNTFPVIYFDHYLQLPLFFGPDDLWKTHPYKFYEYLFSFVQNRAMSLNDIWKTHPITNFGILGYNTDQFHENSSRPLTKYG